MYICGDVFVIAGKNQLFRLLHCEAVNLACEAIQVATMAQKFIDSQKESEKSEGN